MPEPSSQFPATFGSLDADRARMARVAGPGFVPRKVREMLVKEVKKGISRPRGVPVARGRSRLEDRRFEPASLVISSATGEGKQATCGGCGWKTCPA